MSTNTTKLNLRKPIPNEEKNWAFRLNENADIQDDALLTQNLIGSEGIVVVDNGDGTVTLQVSGADAIVGEDGITVISGTGVVTISGFRTEFVAASGSLQSQIDAVEGSDVDSVNALTGAITIDGIGGATVHTSGQTISVSGISQLLDDPSPELANFLDTKGFDVTTDNFSTGAFIAGSGTEVLPAFRFFVDSNTGMMRPDENQIGLVTGSKISLLISSSQATFQDDLVLDFPRKTQEEVDNIFLGQTQFGSTVFNTTTNRLNVRIIPTNFTPVAMTFNETVSGTWTFLDDVDITGDLTANSGTYTLRPDVSGDSVATQSQIDNVQTQIDGIDSSVTLQDAYDNGTGLILTDSGKSVVISGANGVALSISGSMEINGQLGMLDTPIVDVNYIDFNLFNGIGQAEGRMVWNDDDGTINIGMPGGNVNLQVGQEQLVRVRNTTGSTIVNGAPVNIIGASGNRPLVGLADATNPASGAFGITTEDIGNNNNGYVTTFGLVRGDVSQPIDTSGFSVGSRLFVSDTPGELTDVSPIGTTSRVIFIAIVIVSNATSGVLWVSPINNPFLSEISGNSLVSPANLDLIQFSSVSGLWSNKSPATISGIPHGGLIGLSNDDHTQYLLEDGTRPISADWDNTGQRIRNTGTSEVTGTEPSTPATGLFWYDTTTSGITSSGVVMAIRTITVDSTVELSDTVILCDATSGNLVVDLPATTGNAGQTYFLKKIDTGANKVTVSGNVITELIDRSPTAVLTVVDEAITVITNGNNWHIL